MSNEYVKVDSIQSLTLKLSREYSLSIYMSLDETMTLA